jgi:dATP pyrophosphohydrolase
MGREPFQVLVFPFRILPNSEILYAVFRRAISTGEFWQGIAGGGESGESPPDAARREAFEEAGIPKNKKYIQLDSIATIPVVSVCGFLWGHDILVIPEFSFGVELDDSSLQLSKEHVEVKWLPFNEAQSILSWDSNKNALWELDYRLRRRRWA